MVILGVDCGGAAGTRTGTPQNAQRTGAPGGASSVRAAPQLGHFKSCRVMDNPQSFCRRRLSGRNRDHCSTTTSKGVKCSRAIGRVPGKVLRTYGRRLETAPTNAQSRPTPTLAVGVLACEGRLRGLVAAIFPTPLTRSGTGQSPELQNFNGHPLHPTPFFGTRPLRYNRPRSVYLTIAKGMSTCYLALSEPSSPLPS
jgi:hypothetical protein